MPFRRPIAMIIFIHRINWPRACLSATLYVVNMLMISQDATRGGRLVGAVVLLGPAWVAIIFAGLLVRYAPQCRAATQSDESICPHRRSGFWLPVQHLQLTKVMVHE